MTLLLILSPMTILGAAIGGRCVFPISGRWPSVVAAVAVVVALLALGASFGRGGRVGSRPWCSAREHSPSAHYCRFRSGRNCPTRIPSGRLS